jgi:hypothetical protein
MHFLVGRNEEISVMERIGGFRSGEGLLIGCEMKIVEILRDS